jgi:hypothetical protein
MAIWQFKFAMVPGAGIRRVHGHLVHVLDEYRVPKISEGTLAVTSPIDAKNYWEGLDSGVVAAAMSGILEPAKSWSSDALMFGDEDGDRVEVWGDDVDCAIDLRNFSAPRLESIVDVARALGCKLVLHGTGQVIEPIFESILQEVRSSHAYAFCVGPVDFLRGSRSD